ncbi:MAG: DNA lyase [Chlorobiota bacterium]|nr:MAG: DNA lyase [Chlorobiota bacterium]
MRLPPPLDEQYEHYAAAIERRLEEFKAPKSTHDIFYEFCYCICTPQSKARNAWQVVEKLRAAQFYEQGFDPTPVFANPAHYIRFHRTKARRLLALRTQFGAIGAALAQQSTSQELRRWIAQNVAGFGLKEASHVLRNLGRFDVAIVDRHILRNLVRYGVLARAEQPRTEAQYRIIERAFVNFARTCGIELQALDLLLWAIETGEVLK